MLQKFEGRYEIQIPCACFGERIVISRWHDEPKDYCLEFWVSSFSVQLLKYILWDRIKMSWEALRKGTYLYQEIVLSQDKIIELRDDLNKLIEGGKDG